MNRADVSRLAEAGQLASAIVSIPLPEGEYLSELADCNAWIAFLWRQRELLCSDDQRKTK
jgi:hypothetical protein